MNKQEIKEYANKGRERLGSRKWIILLFLLSIFLGTVGITEIGEVTNLYSYKHILVLFSIFCGGTLCILFYSDRKHLHNLVCIIVLVFGLINSIVTPILDSPDEPIHLSLIHI